MYIGNLIFCSHQIFSNHFHLKMHLNNIYIIRHNALYTYTNIISVLVQYCSRGVHYKHPRSIAGRQKEKEVVFKMARRKWKIAPEPETENMGKLMPSVEVAYGGIFA